MLMKDTQTNTRRQLYVLLLVVSGERLNRIKFASGF